MTVKDWRLRENRREAFQRFYSFHLRYQTHPGCVYFALPAIARHYSLDNEQRAWLAWLNGNTQNPAMSLLLLQESGFTVDRWRDAVAFWNDNFKAMDWDTDRRYQKGKFGEATEAYVKGLEYGAAGDWLYASSDGWESAWAYAKSLPHYGRLSAWSGLEYARILLGTDVPDIGSWMLEDKSGSRSHRNGIATVMGHDAWHWKDEPFMLDMIPELEAFADDLLEEAGNRAAGQDHYQDIGRLSMESALCTYKGWHKPNRRYPNVYADMMYERLRKAEARFPNHSFQVLWSAREQALPAWLRLEDNLYDPGLVPAKQNHYLETGEIPVLGVEHTDMALSRFDIDVVNHRFGVRKDKTWT